MKLWMWVGAGSCLGIVLLALATRKRDEVRPLADEVKAGTLFRALVKHPTFTGVDACMRATRVEIVGAHVARIWARIDDPSYPGVHFVEYEVQPGDVLSVAPEGEKTCARVSFRWVEMPTDEPVMLREGKWYRACVELPFYLPLALVRDKVKPALEERGFTDVSVEEDPHGLGVTCDLAIEARWSRDATEFAIPGAVKKAWREG